ncbi:MAG: ATP-binding cassette domain-containing protein [Bifidobacteriaceae bacterium]|jgi:ABC-2 type transport system ATP-binding protein|nr:ATP-binding cassette domain-containing protein [Bifidobacteriaceae bacterium]
MITLAGASVRFGATVAVDGLSGSFPPGRITALVGGDGGGKSSLLRALAGLAPFSPALPPPADRREIGYQSADGGVWLNLSVRENVEFVSRVHGLPGAQARARADELLERAGLEDARDRVAARLSGGMRRKLGFALATLHRPGLVLLDEPTTGVDQASRGELWEMIAQAAAEGATVILATTYLDEAERADQVFLLDAGKTLAVGTPSQVTAQMPGRLWRSAPTGAPCGDQPADTDAGEGAGASALAPKGGETGSAAGPWSWRRGRATYLWAPGPLSDQPTGFIPVAPDLENASVALLLAAERASGRRAPAALSASAAAVRAGPRAAGTAPAEAAPARPEPAIRADNVTRVYGSVTALSGVSLSVGRGEVVGLVGGNGAGKTTLMRIILGIEVPTSGSCELFGAKPTLESRRRLGYVAQGLGLYPSLSARDNLLFAARVHGAAVSPAAAEFAAELGATPVGRLPLGVRRLLAYLAASQHVPELLILDEPSSGMDPLARARLWKALRANAEDGAGVLVTTHYPQEAAQCDRRVMLAAGRTVAA